MTIDDAVEIIKKTHAVVEIIDLDDLHDILDYQTNIWFDKVLEKAYRPEFEQNQRVVFTLSRGDIYDGKDSKYGSIIYKLSRWLNKIDISNYFVILITTDQTLADSYQRYQSELSQDPVPIKIMICDTKFFMKQVAVSRDHYNSTTPTKISLESLTTKEKFWLIESRTFCMYPWIHLHAYPTGEAYPCCQADMDYPVGNLRKDTLKDIWNQDSMKEIRRNMLENKSVKACTRCYEQEDSGFFSGRQSANKHHGHLVKRVHETQNNGSLDQFQLTYWDIRFSNLCNLKCRSCGHIFSSNWYQDQAKLAGPDWQAKHKPIFYAGRFETDAWEQLVQHIDHVEQIYFAGGEPLLMEEHYRILDELVKRELFHVRLVYNTNFTHTDLKGQSVFEYWKKFDRVAVGASLDAQGQKAEYIRKGTDWLTIEQNRRNMLAICPDVDFYISATLSIMNAWHLPDFHRDWVDKGLIKPQDFNVNILQDPPHYRIDIAPVKYKQRLRVKFDEHLGWLKDQDPLNRATVGFQSAINFMMNSDNTHLLPQFWEKTRHLDQIRNENILAVLPELEALYAGPAR